MKGISGVRNRWIISKSERNITTREDFIRFPISFQELPASESFMQSQQWMGIEDTNKRQLPRFPDSEFLSLSGVLHRSTIDSDSQDHFTRNRFPLDNGWYISDLTSAVGNWNLLLRSGSLPFPILCPETQTVHGRFSAWALKEKNQNKMSSSCCYPHSPGLVFLVL